MIQLTASLAFLAAVIAAIVGWFINLVSVIKLCLAGAAFTSFLVLKALGIVVAPLGAILGLFF